MKNSLPKGIENFTALESLEFLEKIKTKIPSPQQYKDPLDLYWLEQAMVKVFSVRSVDSLNLSHDEKIAGQQIALLTHFFSKLGWQFNVETEIDKNRIDHLRQWPDWWNEQEDFGLPIQHRKEHAGMSDEEIATKYKVEYNRKVILRPLK